MSTDNLSNLTAKQRAFAQCVAQGMTQSDAYRKVYNTQAKAKTVNEKASKLMALDKVRSLVNSLLQAKEVQIVRSQLGDRDRVLQKLRYLLDHGTKDDTAKLKAAELLGKSVGLFRDVVETNDTALSADELRAQLEARLSRMLGALEQVPEGDQPELSSSDPEPSEAVH